MGARHSKRLRQAAYSAGPLAPWRSVSYIANEMARINRMLARDVALPLALMESGRVERFRFIISPMVGDVSPRTV